VQSLPLLTVQLSDYLLHQFRTVIIADLQRQLAALKQQVECPEPIVESTYGLRQARRPRPWLIEDVEGEEDELEQLIDEDFEYVEDDE
jgi:hypothetical protein